MCDSIEEAQIPHYMEWAKNLWAECLGEDDNEAEKFYLRFSPENATYRDLLEYCDADFSLIESNGAKASTLSM